MMIASCAAIRGELKRPMFDLVEQSASSPIKEQEEANITSTVNVVDNKACRLDIVETFSPHPRIPYIGAKMSLAAWIVSVMASSIKNATYQSFWLAYLTHWGLVVTSLYILMSAACAVYLAMRPPVNSGEFEGGVGLLIKSTWALFAIAAPAEVMIAILYWILEFEGTVGYVGLMVHGIAMVLIMIDGFILSRIPLRMKQFILFESFASIYILWTAIHAYSGIGNPYANGETPTQDDDAIYGSIAWKNDNTGTVMLVVVVLIVANPVVFMVCRTLSWLLPRRLCSLTPFSNRLT
jgi:hypothetical protein